MEKWRLKRRFHIDWDFQEETVDRIRTLGWPQWSILWMYDYYLPAIDTGTIRKIIVAFYDEDSTFPDNSMVLGVLFAPCQIDLQAYAKLDSKERGIMLFQHMHETLLGIAEDENWD